MIPKVFQTFSEAIQGVNIPHHFCEPIIDFSDRIGDPQSLVLVFQTEMLISGVDNVLSYNIFVGTLKDIAHNCIAGLSARLVTSFEDLETCFVAHFSTNSENPFLVAKLFNIQNV
ncbi:hypothetical protein QL285_073680 [Trifolium repens]|jgi:hypothetical protein|nr:hypothetical protein QL285_073680 [Trifolium repens]